MCAKCKAAFYKLVAAGVCREVAEMILWEETPYPIAPPSYQKIAGILRQIRNWKRREEAKR